MELFFPFITVLKVVHAVRARPRLLAALQRGIAAFVALVGIRPAEVTQRHPMGLFKEDEDDIGLTARRVSTTHAAALVRPDCR